ncbi:MAG: hypothetical protein JWN72_1266 [Thermoleophilia bacterium]|nr:hypothetical protein [Thermoleophilia bacterium]
MSRLLLVLMSFVASLSVPSTAAAIAPPARCVGACWRPAIGTTMHLQLGGTVTAGRAGDIYDIDGDGATKQLVARLHRLDRRVVCYVSAGSYERYRADAARFPPEVLGATLDGWPDERWLDIRRVDLLAPILTARMDACVAKGFDGVDFDNVDGFTNETGFPLTAPQQLRFNKWLADQAHARGLAVALKNDGDQVAKLAPWFDFAVVEQCFQYRECATFAPFIRRGKPVFVAEYELPLATFCGAARKLRFDASRYTLALDGPQRRCPTGA